MLTVKPEATQRTALPGALHKDQAGGDLFAQLLRQLGDGAQPTAEKPRAAQSRRDEEPRGAEAAAESGRPRADRSEERPVADAKRPGKPAEAAEAPSDRDPAERETAAAGLPAESGATPPAQAAAQTDTAATAQPADQATTPAAQPAAQDATPANTTIAAAVPAVPAVPAAPAAPAEQAAVAPEAVIDAAAPAADPVAGEPARPAAAAAGAPVSAPTASRTAAAPSSGAATPAVPAQPASPDAAPTMNFADVATSGSGGTGDSEIAVQPDRAAAQPAQGLAKLGAGAEAALAAQAAGEAVPGPAQEPAGQARKPGATAAQSQSAAAATPAAQNGNAVAPQTAAAVTATIVPPATAAASAVPVTAETATVVSGEDAVEPLGALSTQGQRGAGTASVHAAATPRPAGALPTPAEQVAVQIQRAAGEGASRITVQLKPAELGSIEVQLDFAQDGRVSASILAERPETLDLLQRDARLLERSLQDAGLKADSGSLSFDLRGGGRQNQESPQNQGRLAADRNPAEPRAAAGEATRPATRTTAAGGVDIRV